MQVGISEEDLINVFRLASALNPEYQWAQDP